MVQIIQGLALTTLAYLTFCYTLIKPHIDKHGMIYTKNGHEYSDLVEAGTYGCITKIVPTVIFPWVRVVDIVDVGQNKLVDTVLIISFFKMDK